MEDFSPEDLLEYHYGEMKPNKSLELKERLQNNWPLREKMEVIIEATRMLDAAIEPPRKEAVDYIMEYAEAHSSATI